MSEAGVRFTAGLDMGMPQADHAKVGRQRVGVPRVAGLGHLEGHPRQHRRHRGGAARRGPGRPYRARQDRRPCGVPRRPGVQYPRADQRRHSRAGRQRGQAQRRVAGLGPPFRRAPIPTLHLVFQRQHPSLPRPRSGTSLKLPLLAETLAKPPLPAGEGWGEGESRIKSRPLNPRFPGKSGVTQRSLMGEGQPTTPFIDLPDLIRYPPQQRHCGPSSNAIPIPHTSSSPQPVIPSEAEGSETLIPQPPAFSNLAGVVCVCRVG